MGRGTRLEILSVLCCLFAFVVSGTGCKTVEDVVRAADSDGDGKPDAKDPFPLIASYYGVKWEVNSIDLGWDIDVETTSTKTVSHSLFTSYKTSRSSGYKADSGGRLSVNAKLTPNPLKLFGLFDSDVSFSSSAGGSMNWSGTERRELEKCYRELSTVTTTEKIRDLHLVFTLSFANNYDHPLVLSGSSIPILARGRQVASAEIVSPRPPVTIPEKRRNVDVRFRANLDTTEALEIVECVRNGYLPSIKLERSSIRITSKDDSYDAISAVLNISRSTVPLTIKTSGGAVTFRIAKRSAGSAVTVKRALEALDAYLKRRGNGKGVELDKSRVGSLAGMVDGKDCVLLFRLDGRDVENGTPLLSAPVSPMEIEVVTRDDLRNDYIALWHDTLKVDSVSSAYLRRWSKAVDRGMPEGAAALTEYSLILKKQKKDYPGNLAETAFKILLNAAPKGDSLIQDALGECYSHGVGVAEDPKKAVRWYTKAAERGCVFAQLDLGQCYKAGKGVSKDPAKAVEWVRKAAEQGDAGAQYNLGACYASSFGVPKDPAKAVEWFRKAAEQGCAVAQNGLGLCYDNGDGVPRDPAKAVEWYRKAAEQGFAAAQYNLGSCYLSGVGVPKDPAKAVELYRKAAEQGLAVAQFVLGVCYEDGVGVPKDPAKAVEWY